MKKVWLLLIGLVVLSSFAYAAVFDNLDAWYRFDGDTNDTLANYNITLFQSTGTWQFNTEEWKSGREGNENIFIDGANGLNRMTTGYEGCTGNFENCTLAGWVNVTETPDALLPILGNAIDGGNMDFQVYVSSTGLIGLNWFAGGTVQTITSTEEDFKASDSFFIAMVKTEANISIFINGSFIMSKDQDASFIGANLYLGQIGVGGATAGATDHLNFDEWGLWNRSLDASEVLELWNDGVGKFFGDVTTTFENPTPPSGTRNNTQVIINVSCTAGSDVTLWFDANANPVTEVLSNTSNPDDFTTSVSIEQTYFYKASCNSGETNTSIRTWVFDISNPVIDLSNNFFNKGNFSLLPQYLDTIDANITITDDALFGFLFNMTNLTQVLFNFSTESLSGTSFNFNTTINISGWEADVYNITVMASDSHTSNTIDNYAITKKDKQLVFNTAEGNKITITSDLTAVTNYKKLTDRYSFNYDFGATLTPQKIFTINSDRKITYMPNSIYKAHFVVWNNENMQGNWIDFEGGGIPIVRKINDYNYEITFASLSNKITFNSIGGLNIVTETFGWYRGTTSTAESSSLPVFNTTITLNITNHTSISSIDAKLLYDGVLFDSPNVTGFPEFISFEQNITSASQNVTYNWNVTITQGDGNLSDFLVEANHIISNFGIDNCSTFTEPAFTIFIRDEESNELVIGNGTFTFSYHPDINPTDNRLLSLQMAGRNNFSFCKTDASFNPVGDMSHTFSAPTYETRGFTRVDEPFTGNFSAFLLKTSATVQTVLFTLVDSSLARIEGATMAFHRILGSVLTNVVQGQSDFAGQVSTNLDSQITYTINISHPDFPIKTFILKPVLSTYTIKLTSEGEILFQNAYAGLRYKIEPPGKLFNISDEFQNFTFTVEGNNLEFWGINFSRHNFECIPASCSSTSTSSTGGSVTLGIKLNETGRFWRSLFFKKIGENLVLINQNPQDAVVFQTANRSLIQLVQQVKDNTSENMRTVIAAMVVVVLIAIATMFGIAGWPLAAFASLITLVLSLPSISFINPIFGFFIASAGLITYVISQRA